MTHEEFINAVRGIALAYGNALPDDSRLSEEALARVAHAKLVYGRGHRGLRGVTQYGAWVNGQVDEFIEVCAAGEEDWIQLAGTTIHELGHAATGIGHGHGKTWKDCCQKLGLRRVLAAGTFYQLANFAPPVRQAIAALPRFTDGNPNMGIEALLKLANRPCAAGIGVRGGKTRGVGSGSRLRKYTCFHGQILRASTDKLACECHVCDSMFLIEDEARTAAEARDYAVMLAAVQNKNLADVA